MRSWQSFEALKEPAFRWQFAAQSTSVFGDNVAPVALAFAVLDQTGSASGLAATLLARQLPLAVFVLLGGVWADRLPRQRVMYGADTVRFVTQTGLAALILTGHVHLWEFIVLQAANGTATAFFLPASTGLTPHTVSRERLQTANALMSMSLSAAIVVGPVIGGLLVATVGAGWGLALDGLTFAVSAACLMRVRTSAGAAPALRESVLSDLVSGWSEVRSRRWLCVAIADLALFQILVYPTFFVLGPLLAKEQLGGSAFWGVVVAAWGVGSAVGGAVALRARPTRPLVCVFVTLCAAVPALIALGFASSQAVVVASAIPAGIAMTLTQVIWDTTLQQEIPSHVLSRVVAFDWAGSMALRPLGYVFVAPVAAAITAKWTLAGAAILILVAQAISVSAPSVRRLELRAPRPPVNQAATVQTAIDRD